MARQQRSGIALVVAIALVGAMVGPAQGATVAPPGAPPLQLPLPPPLPEVGSPFTTGAIIPSGNPGGIATLHQVNICHPGGVGNWVIDTPRFIEDGIGSDHVRFVVCVNNTPAEYTMWLLFGAQPWIAGPVPGAVKLSNASPFFTSTEMPGVFPIGTYAYSIVLVSGGVVVDAIDPALVFGASGFPPPNPPLCDGLEPTLVGTMGDDLMIGTEGDDVIVARGGSDVIDAGGGNDTICAGAGDDLITAGPGDDMVVGNAGSDTIDYSSATTGVSVNLRLKQAKGKQGTDRIENVENIIGSPLDDILRGNAKRNIIWGGDGDDGIQGLGGDDELYGEEGDDNLNGRRGDDLIDGGSGIDQATFLHSGVGLTVDLRIAGPQATGDGTDELVGIENLFGSRFNDTLTGNGLANTIKGGKGGDFLYGRGGNDLLIGNQGTDTANGGGGTDTCRTETRIACE